MKTSIKKIVSVLLAVVALVSLCVPCTAYAADSEAGEPVFLLLGDSIADAFGIANRDEACYGRIIADTNRYRYYNLGVTGMTSAQLIDHLDRSVKDLYTGKDVAVKDYIRMADIICMSIGANDYYNRADGGFLAVGAMLGVNDRTMQKIADQLYANLCSILDTIDALNPGVPVILQTYYCVWNGATVRINQVLKDGTCAVLEKYDKAHPGRVHICDISSAMEGKPENLADDCLHPNASGNVAIAGIILQKMYDLGLGTETTPVVNVPGEDWNVVQYYTKSRLIAAFATTLLMLVSGNSVNVPRMFRQLF